MFWYSSQYFDTLVSQLLGIRFPGSMNGSVWMSCGDLVPNVWQTHQQTSNAFYKADKTLPLNWWFRSKLFTLVLCGQPQEWGANCNDIVAAQLCNWVTFCHIYVASIIFLLSPLLNLFFASRGQNSLWLSKALQGAVGRGLHYNRVFLDGLQQTRSDLVEVCLGGNVYIKIYKLWEILLKKDYQR